MFLLSLFLLIQQSVAKVSRSRRASEYRLENASLLPKNFGSLSTGRDNVLAMVAVQLKSQGRSKAEVRDLINQIFTHGCHCGWNYRRHELTDKSKKPNDQLDKVCLDFEHCSECLQVDKCSSDFEPKFNETNFSCDHLPKDSCQFCNTFRTQNQHNSCLCSVSMVEGVVRKVDEVQFKQLTFNNFMDTCVTEIDPSINTQMGASRTLSFDGERYRQCCGEYPARKPFTYSGLNGMACCANNQIYNQKFDYCCDNGSISRIGDQCW